MNLATSDSLTHTPSQPQAASGDPSLYPSMDTPLSVSGIKAAAEDPKVAEAFSALHRADILPHLFKVRGQPYSLEDYPQFRQMYADEYVPDTLYMCGRQVGKSLNLSRLEVFDLITIPELQLLYVAPLQQQAHRYSTLYLNEAIQSCPVAVALQDKDILQDLSDSNIMKSIGHQAFSNGAGIQLTYAKTSADRARGIYADIIHFDEIQDQRCDNIPIISESMTASKWGAKVYTGTAKTADNTIEMYWQKSAQCEWVIKCHHCGHWNIPTEAGNVLEMIQATGVHCTRPTCRKQLNVRLGEWVPAYPDRMKDFRGYHIPQIVVPAIVENPHNWAKIVRKVLNNPIANILQEVLGISCSVGSRLITQADIDRQSVLPSIEQLQARLSRYAMTISGVDWGGAEQTSFTVHTIIGITPGGQVDVLWARRFVGYDPDEILSEIAKAHKYYKCTVMGADYGMGFDRNVMLGKHFGIPVVQIMLVRQNKLLSYSPTQGHHRWTVDKYNALTILFLAIKYGRIFFPPQSQFKLYTDDLLSPYVEVTEVGGLTTQHYLRNPAQPDDFAMSLCFATMTALRYNNIDITDLVPPHAFNAREDLSGVPSIVEIDPAEILVGA